ncbi:MAG: transglutaminase domain-containing protein [Oscillospiraceae bacterium]|nr:transglutaminase domain-containing protein [Oscillospiraceae bacterium]
MKRAYTRFLDRAGNLTLDILCTLLLCFSLSMVLFHLIGEEVSLTECALCTLSAVALCVLVSAERLTIPMLIGIPVLLLIGAGIAAALGFPVVPYLRGFSVWVLDGIPRTDPYSYDFSLHVVHAAMLVPAAAVIYLYYRKLFFLPVLILFSAALMVYAQFNELEGRYILLAVLLVVCLTGLAHTTHRAVQKALRGKTILPEAAMRGAALLFSILVAVPSLYIAKAPDGVWTSKILHQITEDISDFVSYHLYGSGGSSGFSIAWSGFSPDGNQLGGDIHPDTDIVIRVKTETPGLLTGSIYDTYDGQRWYDSYSYGSFRLDSILWNSQQREAFAESNPQGGRKAKRAYDALVTHSSMYLVPGLLYQNYFYSGQPTVWEFGPGCPEPHFNSQGEIFMSEAPESGVSYTVQSLSFDVYASDFQERLLDLESLTLDAKDPLYSIFCESYLDLPDDLPQSVYDMADEITAEAETPAEIAFALEHWLTDNCTYTTTPGSPDPKKDFVAQFLESREGYCTYYATALTVMARCKGLPARYVTGFGMKQNPEPAKRGYVNYNYLVTNSCAHAWTEVYLSGIGWVPFDPSEFQLFELATVPVAPKPVEGDGGTGSMEDYLTADDVMKSLEEQLSELTPEPELPEPEPEIFVIPWGKIAAAAAVLVLLLILILIRSRSLKVTEEALIRRIQRRHSGRSDVANLLFDRILDQLGYLGISFLPGETLRGFRERLCRHFESDAQRISAAFQVIERMDYGLIPPSGQDLSHLAWVSVRLEQALRDELGRRTYFWRRVVFSYYPGRRQRITRKY